MAKEPEKVQDWSITRKVIQIISRHSNLTAQEISEEFRQNKIYANKEVWTNIIHIALISIGAAFFIAGIIFFLAFNWHIIPKMIKLGAVQVLVVTLVISSFFFNKKALIKNILLMCASVLVGAMFSVFGQIYQTGADAYDLFLGWTVFILLWAIAVDFPPLWLLTVILVNITISCYIDQIASYWPNDIKYLLLFIFNSIFLFALQIRSRFAKNVSLPSWLIKVISLSIAVYITIGLAVLIFAKHNAHWPIFTLPALTVYAVGTYQSLKFKSLFNLCIIPLSLIIIVCCLITHSLEDQTGVLFLFLSIFVIACITILVKVLVDLNKTWHE